MRSVPTFHIILVAYSPTVPPRQLVSAYRAATWLISTTGVFAYDGSISTSCQGRAPAAAVLPPDYILPKTYLRVGLLARVSPSGPFCVASRHTVRSPSHELFWKQAESRDRSYRVVAGPSHGFWGRYLVVLDCSGGTSTIHGRPGTVISIRGISTPRRRQRMEIPRIGIWCVKS